MTVLVKEEKMKYYDYSVKGVLTAYFGDDPLTEIPQREENI